MILTISGDKRQFLVTIGKNNIPDFLHVGVDRLLLFIKVVSAILMAELVVPSLLSVNHNS